MITAQDIREKTFEKARIGGYEMGEVDDFLEELAADVAASQKEIGVLKGKMKVLVDKIEEYRETEEDMHRALIAAQKTAREIETEAREHADAIVSEAQSRADELLTEAQEKADSITGDLQARRAEEENRLAAAKEASGSYIEKMLLVCQKQSDFLGALKDMDMQGGAVVTPAPAEKKAFPQPSFDEPEAAEPAEEKAPEYEHEFENAVYAATETAPEAPAAPVEEIDEPTRMFRF